MCLGILGKVVEGVRRKITIEILDDPPASETWVLIHMDFALETVGEVAADEATNSVEMMGCEGNV